MSYSEEYYDAIDHNQDNFNDSVVIRPICMKPCVIPSILNRSNPENTILAAYDGIKLSEFIQNGQNGKVIQLINLQPNSYKTSLTQQGFQFLSRHSGDDVAFVTVIGDKSSGKSFLLDKILNLSNFQGNNFCTGKGKPGLLIWSNPFIKQELKIFIVQLSHCSFQSTQFDALLPYVVILSSTIISLDPISQEKINQLPCVQRLNEKLSGILKNFMFENENQEQKKSELLNSVFPRQLISIRRKKESQNGALNYIPPKSYINISSFYLPNAKSLQYRGVDDDLLVHSFLNKKCVSPEYINSVAQLFHLVYPLVFQKKHKQLVFNGSIILKYLKHLQVLFNKKNKINMDNVYYQIVKDLYLSAYNYCVICYHQLLEQALADEKPRSLDQLLEIFQIASKQVFQKYHQFTLQKSIHEEYQQKIVSHIQSKQRLILQINKKKTDLELTKIYDDNINMNEIQNIWKQINQINKNNPQYSHGKDGAMGKKLGQIIQKLKSGNNVDYRIMKEIQSLKIKIQTRNQQLNSVKAEKRIKSGQQGEKSLKKQLMQKSLKDLDNRIKIIKNQLQKSTQASNMGSQDLLNEKNRLTEKIERNNEIISKLKQHNSSTLQSDKTVVGTKAQIAKVINKQQLLTHTLKELGGDKKVQQNNLKAQNQNNQAKMEIKESNKKPLKQSKQTKEVKEIKDPKQMKASKK